MSMTPCPRCKARHARYVEADLDTQDHRLVCFLCGHAEWLTATGAPLRALPNVREDCFIDHSRQRTIRGPA